MTIGQCCNRDSIVVTRGRVTDDAARLMRQHPVGALAVVDDESGRRRPPAVITDRDLVVEVLAAEMDELSRQVARQQAGERVAALTDG